MQKKLLALAIAGAMAAPLAAQAQGSNVTIYGNLKPSIDFVDTGDESGVSVRSNNSLIGFKGSEDLGNGLKAIFQLESQVEFDERGDQGTDTETECALVDDAGVVQPTGATATGVACASSSGTDGAWVRRDSWVGLEGAFGSVVIGNMFPAYKRSTDFADPFADTIGDYNNIVAAAAEGADEFNTRFRNAVHYISPKFGGFSFQATYGLRGDSDGDGFEDDSDDDGDDDSFSLAGTFVMGPLTLTAAYEDQADAAGEDTRAWKVGAGYTFGSTTIAGLYANEDFGDIAGFSFERDVIFVSAKHSMGKIDLMASYTWADEFDDIDDTGADAFAIGVRYNLSKRTNISALYAKVSNDDNAAYGFDAGYAPADLGENVSGFSVRLQHGF